MWRGCELGRFDVFFVLSQFNSHFKVRVLWVCSCVRSFYALVECLVADFTGMVA